MKKNKLFSLFMALLCAICCSLNAYAGAPDSGKRGDGPSSGDIGVEIGGGGGADINPTTPERQPDHDNPTAVSGDITYDGTSKTLFNEGTTEENSVMYYRVTPTDTKPTTDPKTAPGDWSTIIAQPTNAGSYYLWFYIDGQSYYIDVDVNDDPITNEIQKDQSSVTAAPTAVEGTFVYDGYGKNLFTAGTASGGTMKYIITTTADQPTKEASGWGTNLPSKSDAGTYYLWYYVEGDDNHNDTEVFGPVTNEIQKADNPTITKPTQHGGGSAVSWNGSAQTLFDAGHGPTGTTMRYLMTNNSTKPEKDAEGWGTTIPQQTEIGDYYLWYYLAGGNNYNDTEVNTTTLQKNITKAWPEVTKPQARTLPFNNTMQDLVIAGTTNTGIMYYSLDNENWQTGVPGRTEIGDYTVYYKVTTSDPDHYNDYGPYNVVSRIVAPAASITTSESETTLYTDFNNDLINAWGDGSTLKLLKDVQAGSWYSLNNKGGLTLDLNGFGIRSTSSQYQYATFNLSGTTNVTLIDSNPTATHKFEKDEYDHYATLNESSGNITISGGYITGAPRSAFNVGSGSTLTMNAGTLIGNYSSYTGAAVNVGGTFTMNGGAIMHNYSDQSGTGVYVESDATFKLYGGSITYNLTNGGQGAGVGTSSAANFYMHGQPEIRYNQTLNGEASNVHLYYGEYYGDRSNDVVIQIDDDLDQSEHYRVGIRSDFHSTSGLFVFTNGLDSHSGDASEIHKFFSNDEGYYPINNNGSEAYLYYGTTYLETPTTPLTNATITYDGSSHAMLSAPSTSNGGVVKYQYRFKTHSGSYPAWEETWYTYATLPTVTNAGVYQIRAKAFANSAPGYSDSSTSSSATFTISKANSTVTTPPTGLQLAYTGNEQNLVTAGIVDHTYMVYSTNNSTWHQEIPRATLPGTYTIYYGAKETDNYNGEYSQSMHVITTIAGVEVYDNADPTSTLTNINGVAGMSLIVHRTIYADGEYNTICLPFSMTAEQIAASPLNGYERLKAFRSACVSGTGQELTIDILVDNATSIEAGVPYLISYPSAHTDIVDPVFTGIEVTTTEPSNVSANGVTFQGMFKQVHIDSYTTNDREQDFLFLGSNSQLAWPLNDGTSMRGFRAYFIIDRQTIPLEVAPRGTRARIVERTEVTTAISTVQSNEPQSTKVLQNGQLYIIRGEHMYNAQGQIVK